ncbi:MAG: phenylacetate--CoA ligase family protein [Chloroflexota bacterium]
MKIGTMLGVLRATGELRRRERWTKGQLADYQADALRRLRQYTQAHSPFYQSFHRGLADRPLHELPVLTKATMMAHFDELVTDRAVHLKDVEAHLAGPNPDARFLDRYWLNATSGSSGQPGLFLFNRAEWLAVLASFARAHEWAGVKVNIRHRIKMASVASATPWHMSALVGATVRSWWMPTLRLAASDPLDSIVVRLNAWQPQVLIAYASMARLLADEQEAGRLHIEPQVVYTSSEVLTEDTRRRVEEVWGQHLFNQYATTETGGLAAECEQHRGLHLFEDNVIAEVVDAHNRPVSPGTFGDKLLVTVLFNHTQPLIRYELSDSVRLAVEPCPCGRPFAVVDSIQGRVQDVIHLPASAGNAVTIQPGVFHALLDTVPASGWQVVQEREGLEVLLSGLPEGFVDAALVAGLERALAAQGVVVPLVRVRRVAAIPREPSGKAPLIKALRDSSRSPIVAATTRADPGQAREE